jgi:MFS family permease
MSARPTTPRSVLGLVFLTVFIDLVGFSILFPLFPALLEHYVAREGAASMVGQFQAALVDLIGDREGADFAVVTLFGGLLGSLYSLLQFLSAPFWGGLSDRVGRRRALTVTLFGTALGYVLWALSGDFVVLVLSRLLNGLMAGNIAIASAVVADVSEPERRTRNMAVIGIAVGLGFVLGPALGALAYGAVPLPEAWLGDGALALNPFSAAAGLALALASFNWIWALARFPETLPEASRGASSMRLLNPFASLRRVSNPGVSRTNVVYLLYQTCFAAMEFTLVFLAAERFGFAPRENAVMFVFIGLTIALVQGGLVRRLSGRYDDRRIAFTGIALLVPGFALVGASSWRGELYLGLFLLATGSALAFPSLSALVSRYAPAADQGLALGSFRSMGSLSRALGPVLGGLIYWYAGSAAPYYAGAALLLVPLGMAAELPPLPDSGDRAAEA